MKARLLRIIGTATAVALAVLLPATSASALSPAVVQNVNSNLCMTVWSGSGERPVYQQGCVAGSAFQQWNITVSALPLPFDGQSVQHAHIIVHLPSGPWLCLAARGTSETTTVALTCDDSVGAYWADQRWTVYYWGTGYQFMNENSNLCLAARGFTTSRVIVATCDFTYGVNWADQHWHIV